MAFVNLDKFDKWLKSISNTVFVKSFYQGRIDGHHKQVRLGAAEINLEGKGYDIDSLVEELNRREVTKYAQRCAEGRSFLRRFYICMPNTVPEYHIETMKSTVSMNIQDSRDRFIFEEIFKS